MRPIFGGLVFERSYFWRGLLSNFTVSSSVLEKLPVVNDGNKLFSDVQPRPGCNRFMKDAACIEMSLTGFVYVSLPGKLQGMLQSLADQFFYSHHLLKKLNLSELLIGN